MPVMQCKVISNSRISAKDNMYIVKVAGNFKNCRMGQFYMLRGWDDYPLLSRPISIHDVDDEGASFMYRVIGEGTDLFSRMKKGDVMTVQGPCGNGYPDIEHGKKVALVGGGMGIAPLLYAARSLSVAGNKPDVYLGFREEVLEEEQYKPFANKVVTRIGGTILDDINPNDYDVIFTCGPLGMEKALAEKVKGTKAKLYLSLEKHMACGMGACLVCSIGTITGNKKVCKDGPVFEASEVLFDEI